MVECFQSMITLWESKSFSTRQTVIWLTFTVVDTNRVSSPVASRIHSTHALQVTVSSHSWYAQCHASCWKVNWFHRDADANVWKFFDPACVPTGITPRIIAEPPEHSHPQRCKWNSYQPFPDWCNWSNLQPSKRKTRWLQRTSLLQLLCTTLCRQNGWHIT